MWQNCSIAHLLPKRIWYRITEYITERLSGKPYFVYAPNESLLHNNHYFNPQTLEHLFSHAFNKPVMSAIM